MHFIKIAALGQDYIFSDGKDAYKNIADSDVIKICDRVSGAGATGIFAINQKEPENAQIRAFDKNGKLMRESSTALICACLGANIATGGKSSEILCEKMAFSAHIFPSDNNIQPIVCQQKVVGCKSHNYKTELGNRILSVFPVVTTGTYLVHFSECMNLLNFAYLSKNASTVTKYGKNPYLILAQLQGRNSLAVSRILADGEYIVPYAGGFMATALAACYTDRCSFDEEIKLSCENYEAYAVCKEDNTVMLHTGAEIIYEGDI